MMTLRRSRRNQRRKRDEYKFEKKFTLASARSILFDDEWHQHAMRGEVCGGEIRLARDADRNVR